MTTERLHGSRVTPADFHLLCAMHRDSTVMATLGGVRSPLRTRRFLDVNVRHWERHGFGLWIFRDKARGHFVGRGGLRHVSIHGCPEIEISYALLAPFWGRGLATEIARASLALAAGRGIRSLVAFTLPDNHASRAVMSKLGFRYERDIVYMQRPHVLYRRSS